MIYYIIHTYIISDILPIHICMQYEDCITFQILYRNTHTHLNNYYLLNCFLIWFSFSFYFYFCFCSLLPTNLLKIETKINIYLHIWFIYNKHVRCAYGKLICLPDPKLLINLLSIYLKSKRKTKKKTKNWKLNLKSNLSFSIWRSLWN